MLTVGDLMRAGPLTLEPEESLRAAVDVLVASGTGGAPVVSGAELVGVISLSDILAFEADVPRLALYRADAQGIVGHGFDGDPDADSSSDDGDAETGRWFTDMWDGESVDAASRFVRSEGAEWNALDEHSVSEVMTRKVVSVPPDMPIREAAAVMDRAGVHRLVVTELGALVGVLGARDIVHALARGELSPAPAYEV
jgi:CBS domain-containing protein